MTVYVKTANKGTLNLRAKPNGNVLAQIPYGTKLEAESEGEWSKVTYNGKIGYGRAGHKWRERIPFGGRGAFFEAFRKRDPLFNSCK